MAILSPGAPNYLILIDFLKAAEMRTVDMGISWFSRDIDQVGILALAHHTPNIHEHGHLRYLGE